MLFCTDGFATSKPQAVHLKDNLYTFVEICSLCYEDECEILSLTL